MIPRGLSCIAILIALSSIPATGFAKIGDTPEQLRKEFGDPVATSIDQEGNGLRIYRATDFDEIRITFVAGKSRIESYRPKKGVDPKTLFADLRAEYHGELRDPIKFDPKTAEGLLELLPNKISNQERSDPQTGQTVFVIGSEEVNELKFVKGTKKISVYSGQIERKEINRKRWIIIRAREGIIELPTVSSQPKLDALRPGVACSVTLRDEVPHDFMSAQMAWVGKRVHLDHFDAVDDAHDSLQLVLKIEADGEVLFDRSICEVHNVPMVLRDVPVRDELAGLTADERRCEKDAPHAREFAFCDRSEGESAETYLCPACLTSFKECKAAHPDAGDGRGYDDPEVKPKANDL